MRYNPEIDNLEGEREIQPIKKRSRPNLRTICIERATEVPVSPKMMEALNELREAAVAVGGRYGNASGMTGDSPCRLMIWPNPPEHLKALSILLWPTNSIRINYLVTDEDKGVGEKPRPVVVFLFSGRKSLGLSFADIRQKPDLQIAARIVRDLGKLVNGKKAVCVGLQVQSLGTDGKPTWNHVKKAFWKHSSLKDFITATHA